MRRIDRATASTSLYGDTKWPRLVAFKHIEQEDLQVVAPASNGVHKVYTSGHKAVELTLRRSQRTHGKGEAGRARGEQRAQTQSGREWRRG